MTLTPKKLIYVGLILTTIVMIWLMGASAGAKGLHLSYPPLEHRTQSDRLFFIGTAPPQGEVTINGKVIERSEQGHFAPSLPLSIGENYFSLRYRSQEIKVKVIRTAPPTPPTLGFITENLLPDRDLQVKVNELICFEAIGTPNRTVTVEIGGKTIPLPPDPAPTLPPNSSILTDSNQPHPPTPSKYRGCSRFSKVGKLGAPTFRIRDSDTSSAATAKGTITILPNDQLQVATVKTDNAITRTGASSDYSRLTPLPKGSQAILTAKNGSWWRMDYGAWIAESDIDIKTTTQAPKTIVRSLQVKPNGQWSEIQIPLQVSVPISIHQDKERLFLTLHNTTAQTDTIRQPNLSDPAIASILWEQPQPNQVTYTIRTRTSQQWGYKVSYRGTTLILSIKHPPQANTPPTIVLDPGHGGANDPGAVSPTGYPEKSATLVIGKLLESELKLRGATVIMTRTTDIDMELAPRVAIINRTEPTLALSLHYNALPDNGLADQVSGIGTFWYHDQSQAFGKFLHQYLIKTLKRNDYGIYWGNLALVRPTTAPALLLELGFMINPKEFVWITDPKAQTQLARVLADGIYAWLKTARQ